MLHMISEKQLIPVTEHPILLPCRIRAGQGEIRHETSQPHSNIADAKHVLNDLIKV